jgi:hypothetical protein
MRKISRQKPAFFQRIFEGFSSSLLKAAEMDPELRSIIFPNVMLNFSNRAQKPD